MTIGQRGKCLAVMLLLAACAGPTHRIHYTLIDPPRRELPRKVVMFPANVRMFQALAGGMVEEVPEWSLQSTENLYQSLRDVIDERKRSGQASLEWVSMPALSASEQAIVDEHIDLYAAVASTATSVTRPINVLTGSFGDWQHKLDRFDYSLGDGLRFLAQRTDADAACFAVGRCVIPSAGRVGMGILAAGLGLTGYTAGEAHLHIGLVDLQTGDLLWLNNDSVLSQDTGMALSSFKDPSDMRQAVQRITAPYPGIEEFLALRSTP